MTDVLIVGAGSAGSVLAERLSADERCTVTVVEEGSSAADAHVAEQIADGLRLPIGPDSAVVRRYPTVLTDRPRRTAEIMRGAVVGGSGAVNGGYFCRGLPSDFDGWGLPGWTWDDVLPHFRAIENDLDFDTDVHGRAGPIRIRRVARFDGATAAFVDAAQETGHAWIDDLNGATAELPLPDAGVGAVPLNIHDGQRLGPGGAFLQPVLGRRNLSVLTDTRVERLRWRGTTVVGVGVHGPDGATELRADHVVLCAGAIETARLLMTSGVGPHEMLRTNGIDVVADLPVGVATVDHPEWVLPVAWTPTQGVPPLEAILTTGDGVEIRPYTAGFGTMVGGAAGPVDHPHLGVTLMRPHSRGQIRIDPAGLIIEHRYDSSPADVQTLRTATELARELAGAAVSGEPAWATSQHLCGTARMGCDGDPGAVVDTRARVFGVTGLSVVDGSILPGIPSRGPHATIVMLGHRAAEFFA
ncbi:mycofactocin system GMC family oxidoreductase MftG [Mycobacterium sp. pV006]|uniref:mycofactocin dehydrogenase MftG n=1 Tax=Mycobacterium sp. pV006 TaxID=3238983 RepID=UPI00351BD37C